MQISGRRPEGFIGATSDRHHRNRGSWHGPGYRYVKVRAYDNGVYILRFDEIGDQWELIMFCAAPDKYHDLARSAQSRQLSRPIQGYSSTSDLAVAPCCSISVI